MSRRKRIKYRNFLVKLLIVDGQTVPGPPYIMKGNIFRRMLKEKMSKFAACSYCYLVNFFFMELNFF